MDIRELYKKDVAKYHKSRVIRAYFDWYAYFWFHTEALWIKDPLARRPYTYIFRDWIFPHMTIFKVILAVWYAGMLTWLHWCPYPAAILLGLSSWVAAHLVWGADWIPGQQEDPQIKDI
jgi:hypothetical protein